MFLFPYYRLVQQMMIRRKDGTITDEEWRELPFWQVNAWNIRYPFNAIVHLLHPSC